MTDPDYRERPAATAVIFRDRAGQPPELLMMERSRGMVFAAGAAVFPGGAIDAEDFAHAEKIRGSLPIEEAAARIAAIRESLEESGLAIGFDVQPDRFVVAEMRQAIVDGGSFHSLLGDVGAALDLDLLVPFARWHPNPFEGAKRVFDTRFYIVRLPEGSHEPTVDATENVQLFWVGANEMLDRSRRGEALVIFPTRRNLERLAQFENYDAAVAHARSFPVEKIRPWIEDRNGGQALCIPERLGYPVTFEMIETALRGTGTP
jgi:8-oxo-dGTP pyrophosphatase MutT (NUDIX family)